MVVRGWGRLDDQISTRIELMVGDIVSTGFGLISEDRASALIALMDV